MARRSIVLGSAPTNLIIRSAKYLVLALSCSGGHLHNLQFEICNLQSKSAPADRKVERTLQIELPQLLEQRRVVDRINQPLILQEIKKAALRYQVLNVRIIPQRDDSWVLTQFVCSRKRKKTIRDLRIRNHLTNLAERFVSLRWNGVRFFNHVADRAHFE